MAEVTSFKVKGKQKLMPGSFGPEDYIEFYDNPFDNLESVQAAFRARESRVPWSANNLSGVDVTNVDWYEYTPPKALSKAPNITAQVLLDIVFSSIENVKTQAADQKRQKLDDEQSKLDEDNARKLDKGKEPYLPIIIPQDRPVPDVKASCLSITSQSDSLAAVISPDLAIPIKIEKRRKFALRKLFQRTYQRGESSATGSTLDTLRKIYESRQSSEASRPDHLLFKSESAEELVECVSCLDDFSPKEVIKVPCHSYCRDCFVRLISTAVQNEQQWPPKCCLNPIPAQTIIRFIPSELKATFQDRSSEWNIPIGERIYCSHQGCNLLVKPKNISARKREGTCDSRHTTCTICRDPGHKGKECERDPDMELTNMLAEEEGWKRCFNCNALVEHREACQHMTCRCGTQFCYVCGLRWRTCSCTAQQLDDIKTAAETKREQRLQREQNEVEELRLILLQIEEFEREEALKAEMLRQEQERLEEERRQRELEERVRQESIRRRDIELKYQELRAMLDQLHELQQVLVEVDQDEMANDLATEMTTAKEELAKKQETERSEFDSLIMTKMADKEYELNKEFQIRAAEENDIEEAYHEKLQDYWKEKNNGEAEIEKSMLAVRKRMDRGQHMWQKWKKETMQLHEAGLKEDWSLREEIMYSKKHRLGATCEDKEKDLVNRKKAEKKWLEMVILERERLMNEWEVQEVEGDADSLFSPDSDSAVVVA
ncbi:hypothetical protein B0J13DRAFT_73198 [Dactylonectria estremocensis]|uniref:RBR-type E3 ubiquitin transferase n=1 Tax=Dactylonectria estremocensis TaxID=1079267 RepID=A0A9P9IVK7_9HYPO|nr:hypothetical protein B0J13DRAFT_73198 [Dactylonectria estremocensis]